MGLMRPRIKKYPKIVASSSNDEAIQSLCAFNRREAHKNSKKVCYIMSCWGKTKEITKAEYDKLSKQFPELVKRIYK